MSSVFLMPVGTVDPAILTSVEDALRKALGIETGRLPGQPEPTFAWDATRHQYSSSLILDSVVAARPREAGRLLGVTESDLFIPMLSFVYGQAQLEGPGALLSLARLRQEFYGLPADADLLLERVCKEALHELGHTFGLVHCPDKGCAMALSTNIRQVDIKAARYCKGCSVLSVEGIRRAGLQRATAGEEFSK